MIDKQLDKIQGRTKLTERAALETILVLIGAFIFLALSSLKGARDTQKIYKLTKEILPKVKPEMIKLHKQATPKVQKIAEDLYRKLKNLKDDELEVLKTYGFYSWYDENEKLTRKSVQHELFEILNKRSVEEDFNAFLKDILLSTVKKVKKSKKGVKNIPYDFTKDFFTERFGLQANYDAKDDLPPEIKNKSKQIYNKIDRIITNHDKKVSELCNDYFMKMEKIVIEHLRGTHNAI